MAQLGVVPRWPAPPSWYPGHMKQFTRMLPALLSKTDVVLELRDSRLPLTSVNPTFEGMLLFDRSSINRGYGSQRCSAGDPSLDGDASSYY